jgi:hypothetical protein
MTDTRSVHAVDAAAWRPPAVVALLGLGAIQSFQIVHEFQSTPLIAIADGALIAGCVAVAAWLLATRDVRAWGVAGLISVVATNAFVSKNFVGTTLDPRDVGNWRFALDLAPLFVAAALLALSGLAMALVHAQSGSLEPRPS